MSRNLGQCSLRRKRRVGDPMTTFDGLPAPLRQWLSQAALPWSPISARRIWLKSRAEGLSPDEAILALHRVETRMLERDRQSVMGLLNADT